jgi:hypothetical protein
MCKSKFALIHSLWPMVLEFSSLKPCTADSSSRVLDNALCRICPFSTSRVATITFTKVTGAICGEDAEASPCLYISQGLGDEEDALSDCEDPNAATLTVDRSICPINYRGARLTLFMMHQQSQRSEIISQFFTMQFVNVFMSFGKQVILDICLSW